MIIDAFGLLWTTVQRQVADGRPELADRAFSLLERGLADYAVR
jgi:hypothetical protein